MLEKFKQFDVFLKIIIINAVVFFGLLLLGNIAYLFNASEDFIYSFLYLKADFPTFLIQPWRIITHMFLHADFSHILWNMVMLYFLGKLFLNYFSEKIALPLYFVSGIVGAFLLFISYQIFPVFQGIQGIAVGASAAVMGVVIAICTYRPKEEVFLFGMIKVPLMYIGLFYFLMDIVSFKSNTGGHIAHIGGAAFGYVFATQYKKGNNILTGVMRWLDIIATFFKKRPKSKMKVVYKTEAKNLKDEDYNASRKEAQEKVDAILDKISRSGWDSLTKSEKDFLNKINKK